MNKPKAPAILEVLTITVFVVIVINSVFINKPSKQSPPLF